MRAFVTNWLLVLAAMIFGLTTAAQAKVVYVVPGGSGDGSSWTSPKGTIADGLAASVSGDQIWVKQGTYNEAITLKAGVWLLLFQADVDKLHDQRQLGLLHWRRGVLRISFCAEGDQQHPLEHRL